MKSEIKKRKEKKGQTLDDNASIRYLMTVNHKLLPGRSLSESHCVAGAKLPFSDFIFSISYFKGLSQVSSVDEVVL